MILIKKILNLLKIKNNIETNLKFSKGDKVIIKIYDRNQTGFIKDIRVGNIENYKVIFTSDDGKYIWYWFSEDELETDKQYYRDLKLKRLGIF
jgi:hypothetical protein